ncbi:MAG: DUF4115 domain-containing protein [Actinobacteria bacterium]|jgi:septal ring-binding cell division protein DamX|nr:DUF4115 domain-containing protein [Actinomycetota bacterium]MCL6105442.1 DUF4115 domain-containing protein [Actinomycetota bacterium]
MVILLILFAVLILLSLFAWLYNRSSNSKDIAIEKHEREMQLLRHMVENSHQGMQGTSSEQAAAGYDGLNKYGGLSEQFGSQNKYKRIGGFRKFLRHDPSFKISKLGGAVLAIVVVVLLVITGIKLIGSSTSATPAGSSTPVTSKPSGDKAISGNKTATTRPAVKTKPKASSTKNNPKTTVTKKSVSLISFNSATAQYSIPGSTFTLTVDTTGPCWIEVTQGVGGSQLWQGTLVNGQSRSFAASTPLWIRMGAVPEVQLLVDNVPVALPPGSPTVYNAVFSPS